MSDINIFEGVNVGDYIYCYAKYGAGIIRKKVIDITDKNLIIKGDSKVRKSDGYVIGSGGSSRFDSFNSIYYYKETEELKSNYMIQFVKSHITGFGHVNPDKIKITPENIDSIWAAVKVIEAVIVKEEKEIK